MEQKKILTLEFKKISTPLTSLANIAPPSGAWGLCSTSFFFGRFIISLFAGHVGNIDGSTGDGDS